MKVNVNGVWKDSKPYVNVNGIWVPVNTVWTNVQGVWKPAYRSEFIHTITSNTLNFNLFNTIGIPEEDIITLVINPLAHVYSNSASQVALDIGNAYTGKTVNIINKGHIYGAGGAASAASGNPGGTALYVRTANPVNLFNEGTVAGGGGSGGKGGTGGPGYYTTQSSKEIQEPAAGELFDVNSYFWNIHPNGTASIHWAGGTIVNVQGGIGGGPFTASDGWTYYIGSLRIGNYYGTGPMYAISRRKSIPVTNTINTNGGAGGNGGQGFGPANSVGAGALGLPGGTNAGAGGKGGSGGTFGNAGATGAAGVSGNRGAGTAGSSGGRAGYSIDGNSKVIVKTTGTILGPRVN